MGLADLQVMSEGQPTAITSTPLRNYSTFPPLSRVFPFLNFRAITHQIAIAPVPFLLLPTMLPELATLNFWSRITQAIPNF